MYEHIYYTIYLLNKRKCKQYEIYEWKAVNQRINIVYIFTMYGVFLELYNLAMYSWDYIRFFSNTINV